MQEIGTVISTLEGPSSNEFSFVIKESEGIPIRKGQFVQLETEEGLLIARVSDIIKTNRYFSRAESVSEFEKSGRPLIEQFPVDRWEYLVANAIPLGVYSNGQQSRVSYPASPGQKVYKVDENILSDFFGFDNNSGINLGKVEFHDLNAKLNITKLFQKHLAILAISGAGKSYCTSVLIEELLDRLEKLGKPAIILFDPHGEYIGFSNDEKYINRAKVYSKNTNISIAVNRLSITNIGELIPQMSAVQRRELAPIIKKLRDDRKPYTLFTLIDEVEHSNINPKTKIALISWLSDLNYTGLFEKYDSPNIEELAKAGQLSIFDLSDFVHLKDRQIILTYFTRKLFEARRQNKIPPFILIAEEAHQFCLSEDTEILTTSGWKKYNEIKVGDFIFSYNKKINKLEPNPIERIIVKEHNGELIKLYNQDSIDSLVTEDHRVLCHIRTTGKGRKWNWSEPRFILAKNLPTGIKIPVAIEIVPNSSCNLDNDLIKILGWIITDGHLHFTRNRKHFHYVITQSKSKGNIIKEIKEVTTRRFPESKIYSRKRKDRFYNNRYIRGSEELIFYLGKKATEEINHWLGSNLHRIPRQFLEKASLNQLKVLFESLVQGDGSIQYSKNNHRYITFYAGHDHSLADDFQELCVRLGLSAVKKIVPQNKQIKVLVSFKRKFSYIRKIRKENFSGKVWDITIKHGAFTVRRNGRVFITGNCPNSEEEQALSRSVVEQIAREGRKFNACLVLISQRPKRLSTTALSQCNTHVIMRVTNPVDLQHISESSEGISSDVLDMIPGLKVGEALIVGEAVNYPILVKVRERKSKKSEKGMKLEDALKDFNKVNKLKREDLEAFS